ncbi:MAG: pyruvate kinase [Patescibacteria group bacterium]|nr:pyruvate kinase [Patescibacteria group bacterium]
MKHTKIGATVGPSCQEKSILKEMVKSGMNFARLNFSHGTYDNHALLIKNIREVEEETNEPLAIMQDLQGPKIRLGILPEDGVELKTGEEVALDTSLTEYKKDILPLTFPGLEKFIQSGERILINDGRVEIKVEKIEGSKIYGKVIEGGVVTSHKGFNFPETKLSIPALSDKDKEDLKFGVKAGVDIVALSFVTNAKDILDLKFLIKQYEEESGINNEQPIRIIAKIERHEAVDNIKEILDVADGIMVARGDLGLEMPAEELPLVQKKLIDAANGAAKPVIVATQMLDSMQNNRRPTRAEVSDVANAVIDHADALLLTNETASGKYPALTVKTMHDIILATEKSTYDDANLPKGQRPDTDLAITKISRILAEEVEAKLILAASISGETGRLISRVRPELSILVATNSDRSRRQLNLSWGIRPFILPFCRTIEELVERSINYIKKEKIAKNGDKMIIVAGEPVGQAGNVNLVEVREIK